jgi:uncharacterized membrane protein YdjX (TVP38/TMEM64 family)
MKLLRTLLAQNKFSFFYLICLGVLPLLFSSAVLVWLVYNQGMLKFLGLTGWIKLYLLSVFTMAFALTPTTFIALITGYFLGMSGAFLALPSYVSASLLGFYAGRFVDRGNLLTSVGGNEKVSTFLRNLKEKEFTFIVLSRLSPVLPFSLMNFVLSAMQVNLKNFLTAGTLGMLPRTLLFIWVGTRAVNLQDMLKNPGQELFVNLITIGLVVLTVAGITYVLGKAIRNA